MLAVQTSYIRGGTEQAVDMPVGVRHMPSKYNTHRVVGTTQKKRIAEMRIRSSFPTPILAYKHNAFVSPQNIICIIAICFTPVGLKI